MQLIIYRNNGQDRTAGCVRQSWTDICTGGKVCSNAHVFLNVLSRVCLKLYPGPSRTSWCLRGPVRGKVPVGQSLCRAAFLSPPPGYGSQKQVPDGGKSFVDVAADVCRAKTTFCEKKITSLPPLSKIDIYIQFWTAAAVGRLRCASDKLHECLRSICRNRAMECENA